MRTPDTQDTSSNGTPGSEDEPILSGADQAIKEAENSILDVLDEVKDATRRELVTLTDLNARDAGEALLGLYVQGRIVESEVRESRLDNKPGIAWKLAPTGA